MSAFLEVMGSESHAESLAAHQLTGLLSALANSDMRKIPPGWLAGTKEWKTTPSRSQSGAFDLLAKFVAALNELAEQGAVPRDEAYHRAIAYVERLSQRRAALDPAIVAEARARPPQREVSLLKTKSDDRGMTH